MSSRIHNGFRIDHCDLGRLSEALAELRAAVTPLAKREHAELVATRTCSLIDRTLAKNRDWPASPLGTIWRDVDEASSKILSSGMRDPSCDFGFEISLIPDASTSSIYGILHCERDSWRRLWMRRKEVSDHSWWNNSDRPSGVTAGDWRRRGETWERIMPSMVPAAHGMSALISPVRLMHTLPDPMRHQPSLAKRRKAVAMDLLFDRYAAEDVEAEPGADIMQTVMKASRRAKTPEGQALAEEIAEGLRLPRRISIEMAMSRTMPTGMDLV